MPDRIVRWVWAHTHQPRAIATIHAVIYTSIAAAGAYALFEPPRDFEELSTLAGNIVGVLLVGGGVMAALAAIPGIWWAERAGIVGLLGGMSTYMLAIIGVDASTPGNEGFRGLLGLALTLCLIVRLLLIRDRPYAAHVPRFLIRNTTAHAHTR